MNNSYITIIKEKRTALSRKRVPLNQNECTDDFRIGVPFEQNLHAVLPAECSDKKCKQKAERLIREFKKIYRSAYIDICYKIINLSEDIQC